MVFSARREVLQKQTNKQKQKQKNKKKTKKKQHNIDLLLSGYIPTLASQIVQ